MLQIKTIVDDIDHSEKFDAAVNDAQAEGWTLTKRNVLNSSLCILLYAELEKVIITEAERDCGNCRYGDQDGGEPCDSCNVEVTPPTNWEEA